MSRWGAHEIHHADYHVRPALALTPDITRGEERFTAEVVLAELKAQAVPTWAHERAVNVLEVLARG